jgi:hypothetical protein
VDEEAGGDAVVSEIIATVIAMLSLVPWWVWALVVGLSIVRYWIDGLEKHTTGLFLEHTQKLRELEREIQRLKS